MQWISQLTDVHVNWDRQCWNGRYRNGIKAQTTLATEIQLLALAAATSLTFDVPGEGDIERTSSNGLLTRSEKFDFLFPITVTKKALSHNIVSLAVPRQKKAVDTCTAYRCIGVISTALKQFTGQQRNRMHAGLLKHTS